MNDQGNTPDIDVSTLPYRTCVGIALFNRDGRVFVGQRAKFTEDAWQMPQGGVDPGEQPRAAALRELEEEVGTAKVEIIAEIDEWLDYDIPQDVINARWKGKYRGQRQKWFAMRFTGADSDIDLDHHGKPEFRDWKWVDLEDVPPLIVDFKRAVYDRVAAEFAGIATAAA